MVKIGLNLSSLGEEPKRNLSRTLQRVKRIGYEGVQFTEYYSVPAKVLRKMMMETGIRPAGSHIPLNDLRERTEQIIEYCLGIGDTFIVCPGLPEEYGKTADGIKKGAELINAIGRKVSEAGLVLAYHNNSDDFHMIDGLCRFDILLPELDPGYVKLEFDMFAAGTGRAGASEYIRKYGVRCYSLHIGDNQILDMAGGTGRPDAETCAGAADLTEIMDKAENFDIKWIIVNQKNTGDSVFESIRISYQNLAKLLNRVNM